MLALIVSQDMATGYIRKPLARNGNGGTHVS